jgi:hypothetical protein
MVSLPPMNYERNYLQQWISSESFDFEREALALFRDQSVHNAIYKNYVHALNIVPERIQSVEAIPFLPISFFKTHTVKTGFFEAEAIFSSSATGGRGQSLHHMQHLEWYGAVCRTTFEQRYGPLSDWSVFALLPSYLERGGSSLVWMVQHFIERSGNAGGFFLDDHTALRSEMASAHTSGKKVLLIGVTFALLDFALGGPLHHPAVVMETGGMKGRRKEMIREEVHKELQTGLAIKEVHSEYGMTELTSQGYATDGHRFSTPRWMKVLPREVTDPLSPGRLNATAGLNVIDLANAHSCAFVATEDLGIVREDGSFEVVGRFDHAEVRGCNLMVAG